MQIYANEAYQLLTEQRVYGSRVRTMIVLKFGGTSVQNAQMMDRTLDIVASQLERAPVLVSSAMAKVTDQLQDIARLVGAGKEEEAVGVLEGVEERHLACARELLTGENLGACEGRLRAVCN
jgi:aspartate kinase